MEEEEEEKEEEEEEEEEEVEEVEVEDHTEPSKRKNAGRKMHKFLSLQFFHSLLVSLIKKAHTKKRCFDRKT